MPIPQRVRDWTQVKAAFLERAERPTYGELSAEFAIPEGSIKTVAADEGWPFLRAQRLEAALVKSDAASAIIQAASNDRAGLERFRTAVFVFIQDTVADVNSIRDKFTEAKRIKLRQDASFTILNLSAALKNVGLTGIAKELRDRLDGRQEGDEWQRAAVLVQVNQLAGGGSVSVGPVKEKPAETMSSGPAAGGTPSPASSAA